MRGAWMVLAALVIARAARAQCCAPPVSWVADVNPSAQAGTALPSRVWLGPRPVMLEQTTLAQAAGASHPIGHAGEAGTSAYWLCYATPPGRVWLIADGEMGGPEHRITEVIASAPPPGALSTECPGRPAAVGRMSIEPNIGLGTPVNRLVAALGAPVSRTARRIAFASQTAVSIKGSACTTTRWVGADLAAGKVTRLDVRQITAC